MPIHDYVCNKCKTSKEKIVKFSDADTEFDCVIEKCKGKMVKSIKPSTGTRAILRGRFH